LRFADLFAGIAGFHLAFQAAGAECVLHAKIDKFAQEYRKPIFKICHQNCFQVESFAEDVGKVDA